MKPKYTLTKIEKLQMHRLMWLWISEGAGRSKFMWWNIYCDDIDIVIHKCFLCDIYLDIDNCSFRTNSRGSECPLGRISDGYCEGSGPYAHWKYGDDSDRKIHACKIAHCVDSLLDKLELGW